MARYTIHCWLRVPVIIFCGFLFNCIGRTTLAFQNGGHRKSGRTQSQYNGIINILVSENLHQETVS